MLYVDEVWTPSKVYFLAKSSIVYSSVLWQFCNIDSEKKRKLQIFLVTIMLRSKIAKIWREIYICICFTKEENMRNFPHKLSTMEQIILYTFQKDMGWLSYSWTDLVARFNKCASASKVSIKILLPKEPMQLLSNVKAF